MKVKYIRVSSLDQNISRQEINSKSFDRIYVDKVSGAINFTDRPEGAKLIQAIKNGSISELHIQAVDRLGRDILDILSVLRLATDHGVNIFVENIGMYSMLQDKVNPTFKMIVSILGNVAEMERNSIRERQKEGIALAKAKGAFKGRVKGSSLSSDELLAKYPRTVKELKKGVSLRDSAKLGCCSVATAKKIKDILNSGV